MKRNEIYGEDLMQTWMCRFPHLSLRIINWHDWKRTYKTTWMKCMHMKHTQSEQASTFWCWMSFSVRTIESFKKFKPNVSCTRRKKVSFWIGCCMIYIERFVIAEKEVCMPAETVANVRCEENTNVTATNSCNQWIRSFHRHKKKYYVRIICACKSWPKKKHTILHSWLRVWLFFAFCVFIGALSRRQCRLKPHSSVKNALKCSLSLSLVWDHWTWMPWTRLQFMHKCVVKDKPENEKYSRIYSRIFIIIAVETMNALDFDTLIAIQFHGWKMDFSSWFATTICLKHFRAISNAT